MPAVTFVTTCMGRLEHLRQTLPTWLAQPDCACVVVDYSCPDRCGDWVEQTCPQARVVRVPGRSRFHITHARNTGGQAADTLWLGFVDADMATAPGLAAAVLPLLRPDCFLRPERRGPSTLDGFVICSREQFARAGGYDEVMQNYGAEDWDFYNRLRMLGYREVRFPADLLRPLAHDSDLRVRFYDIKQPRHSDALNTLYMTAKLDLMRLLGRALAVPERQQLYALVTDWVTRVLQGGEGGCEMRLSFRREALLAGGTAVSTLVYQLHPGLPDPPGGSGGPAPLQ